MKFGPDDRLMMVTEDGKTTDLGRVRDLTKVPEMPAGAKLYAVPPLEIPTLAPLPLPEPTASPIDFRYMPTVIQHRQSFFDFDPDPDPSLFNSPDEWLDLVEFNVDRESDE